jgi:SAM-dependent methyltransferase
MMRVDFAFVCPECRGPLELPDDGRLRCSADENEYPVVDGIPRLITDDRFEGYRRFIDEYETVRKAEGRGVTDQASYRALPFADLDGRHRGEWRIRAASFHAMMELVVAPMAEEVPHALTIADLGAGTTWMSRRLALARHRVVAVDLDTDPTDGLGAKAFSEHDFDAVQAEFDRLPIPDGVCDIAIFNGAVHYSTDPAATLTEALRILRPGGAVVILDTPIYRSAAAGREMVADREQAFREQFGFASNSIECRGFLTFAELEELARALDIEWRCHRPFFGFRWALRPLWAKIRMRREPADFLVVWAHTARTQPEKRTQRGGATDR